LDSQKITELIDGCWVAVENSKAGKIRAEQKDGAQVINNLGFNVFLAVLSALLPKNFSGDMAIKEPEDPWKGGSS
jgi:hypothetical protein